MCCGARVLTGPELLLESWEVEDMEEVKSQVEFGGTRDLSNGNQSSHFLTCPLFSGRLQIEEQGLPLE